MNKDSYNLPPVQPQAAPGHSNTLRDGQAAPSRRRYPSPPVTQQATYKQVGASASAGIYGPFSWIRAVIFFVLVGGGLYLAYRLIF